MFVEIHEYRFVTSVTVDIAGSGVSLALVFPSFSLVIIYTPVNISCFDGIKFPMMNLLFLCRGATRSSTSHLPHENLLAAVRCFTYLLISCDWDKLPNSHKLKDERLIWVHSFSGFRQWLAGSRAHRERQSTVKESYSPHRCQAAESEVRN